MGWRAVCDGPLGMSMCVCHWMYKRGKHMAAYHLSTCARVSRTACQTSVLLCPLVLIPRHSYLSQAGAAAAAAKPKAPSGPIAFLFPGQGSQAVGMLKVG